MLGEESNVLQVADGRRMDINAPVKVDRGESFTFTSTRDEMDFYDAPRYKDED